VLEDPERILEAEAGDTEPVVQESEQKVQKYREQDRTPVNDCLKIKKN
jgi:hypothetical protein